MKDMKITPIPSSLKLDLYELIHKSVVPDACRDILLCDMNAHIAVENIDAETANALLGEYQEKLRSMDRDNLCMLVYETAIMTDSMHDGTTKIFMERSGTHVIDIFDIHRHDFESHLAQFLDSASSGNHDLELITHDLSEGRRVAVPLVDNKKLWLNPANASAKTDTNLAETARFKQLKFSFGQFCDIFVKQNSPKDADSSMEI